MTTPEHSLVEKVARAIVTVYNDRSGSTAHDVSPVDRAAASAAIEAMGIEKLIADRARLEDDSRDAIVKAYIAGATDVHETWVKMRGENDPPDRDPSFTEAAHDYASNALTGNSSK